MKKNKNFYELIAKNLDSNLTNSEQETFDELISNNSENEKTFFTLKEFWTKFFPRKQHHSIIEKTKKKLGFIYDLTLKANFRSILKIAAIIIFMTSFGFSTYQVLKPKQKLVSNEYCCTAGEVKEVKLSDGTKVWLNSKSFLIACKPFVDKITEVKLYGEAYFKVAHNEEQPFIIKTPLLKTRVLRTHITTTTYPTDEIHEIALHEDKIKLPAENRNNPKIVLKPADKVYYTTVTGTIKIVKTDLGEAAKWRDEVFNFIIRFNHYV